MKYIDRNGGRHAKYIDMLKADMKINMSTIYGTKNKKVRNEKSPEPEVKPEEVVHDSVWEPVAVETIEPEETDNPLDPANWNPFTMEMDLPPFWSVRDFTPYNTTDDHTGISIPVIECDTTDKNGRIYPTEGMRIPEETHEVSDQEIVEETPVVEEKIDEVSEEKIEEVPVESEVETPETVTVEITEENTGVIIEEPKPVKSNKISHYTCECGKSRTPKASNRRCISCKSKMNKPVYI